MARTPADRRIARFLANSAYGPKFGRLLKRDQREILDLINQGRSADARKLTLTKDEDRRRMRRTRDRARRYSQLPPDQRSGDGRPTDETTEFWRFYEHYKAA